MSSNHGGARPGAGRPQLETIKVPKKQDCKWVAVGIPLPLWQEFCEAAASGGIEESDYSKFADLVMIEAMDRYIRQKKRTAKKKAE